MDKLSTDPVKRHFFIKLHDLDAKEKIPFSKRILEKADEKARTIKIYDFRDILNAVYPDVEGSVINRVMGEFKEGQVYNYEGFLNILYDMPSQRRAFDKFSEDICSIINKSQTEFWRDYDHEAMKNKDLRLDDIDALFRKYGVFLAKKEKDLLLFFCESERHSENIDLELLRGELGKNLLSTSTFIKDNKSFMKRPRRKIKECLDMIVEAIKNKNLKVEIYFEKYGWDSTQSMISEKMFDIAFRDLNLDITATELEDIKASLGLVDGKSELNLDTLTGRTSKSSMFSKANYEPKLEFVLDETNSFLKKNPKVDLLSLLKMNGDMKMDSISDVEFTRVYKENIYALDDETVKLIVDKFGQPRKRTINYKLYMDALHDMKKKEANSSSALLNLSRADTLKFDNKLSDFYKKIRITYKTFDAFVKKFDNNGNDRIERSEFSKALLTVFSDATEKEIEFYYLKFTSNQNYVDIETLKRVFKTSMEIEARAFTDTIVHQAETQKRTLYNIINMFPLQGEMCELKYVQLAVQSLAPTIHPDDTLHLVSFFNIRINSANCINYEQFCNALDEFTYKGDRHLFRRSDTIFSITSNSTESPEKKAATKSLVEYAKKMELKKKEAIVKFFESMSKGAHEIDMGDFRYYSKKINPDYKDNDLNDIFRQIAGEKPKFTVVDFLDKIPIQEPIMPGKAGGSKIFDDMTSVKSKVFEKADSKIFDTRSDAGFSDWGLPPSNMSTERFRDIFDKTRWAKELFHEIKHTLAHRNQSFKEFFKPERETLHYETFKVYLEDLKLPADQITRLTNSLLEDKNSSYVNLTWFETAYNQFSQEKIETKAKITPYQDIKRESKKPGNEIEKLFADYQKQGTVKKMIFKDIIEKKLKVPLTEAQLQLISDECADSKGEINLNVFKKLVDKADEVSSDVDVKNLIKKIKDTAKSSKVELDQLFKLFDKDSDGWINFDDFKEFAKPYERNMQKISDNFKALCKNEEGRISKNDFDKIFEEPDARYARFCKLLKGNYANLQKDLDKEFNACDDTNKGVVNLKGFTYLIEMAGVPFDKEDIVMMFDKSQSTERDLVKKEDFLRIFIEFTEAENKHLKDIINQVHDKIFLMGPERKNELLAQVDKNGEKKVVPEEFKTVMLMVMPGLLTSEAAMAFNFLDKSKKHFLSIEEFDKALGFDGGKKSILPAAEKDPSVASLGKSGKSDRSKGTTAAPITTLDLNKDELVRKMGWASDLFEEIGFLIGCEETTIDLYFNPGKEPTSDKIMIKRQFKALGLEISDEVFDRLINFFTYSGNQYQINTSSFIDTLYYFNSHPKRSLDEFKLKHLDKIRDEIITKMNAKKLKFSEAFNHLSKDNRGICYRIDLQTLLINKFDVPNNTNLKILFNYIKDGLGEVNLGRLEFFLNELMRSQLKPAATGVKPMDEEDLNIQKLILRIKNIIESNRMKVEAVFKHFDVVQDQELSYEEFYRALKYFDPKLTRQEIWSIFNYLDVGKHLKITKVKFVRTFGKLTYDLMLSLLEWAIPIFKEIALLQAARKVDILGNILQDEGYCEKEAFRTALVFNDFPYDSYRHEMERIIDIASDEVTGRVNVVAISKLVEKAKNQRQKKLRHQFTGEEEQKVFHMIKDIASFIKMDGLDFDQLFMPFDYHSRAKITIDDLNHVLVDELMINSTPTLQLLFDFLCDDEDLIDLVQLKKLVVKEDEELRKVLNLPYFLKELKTKFNNDIPLIMKVFDPNKNNMVNLEEFVNGCMRALNMKPDFSKFYFLQLDQDHDGQLSIIEFQDALLEEGDIKWERTKKIRDEMEKKRILLARNFTSFDRNNDKLLTLNHIKAVLSMSEIYVDERELEDLLRHYKVDPDKNKKYDYTELIQKILSDSDEEEKFALADRTLQMLKQKFVIGNINYERDLEAKDENGDGRIYWRTFEDYLTQNMIPVSNLEKQNLRWLMKPSQDDKISWRTLIEYIHLGVNRVMTKEELIEEGNFMKDFILGIKYQMKRNFYSVSRLFGTDKDVVSMDDFRTGIGYLGFKNHLSLPKLCKLVADGKSTEFASLQKFEFLIHGVQDAHDGFEKAEKDIKSEKMQFYFRNKDSKDTLFLEQRFTDLKTFMTEDRLTFKDLFLNMNISLKDGLLYAKDFEKILAKKLQLDIDETLKRFIRLIIDNNEMINLEMLENLIDAPKAYADKKQVADLPLEKVSGVAKDKTEKKNEHIPESKIVVKAVESHRSKEDTFRDLGDVLNGAFICEFSGNLMLDMGVFFRAKKLSNPERYRLFDPKLVGKIPKAKFVEIVRAMNIKGTREADVVEVFNKLDKNRTDYISENEFRLAFDEAQNKQVDPDVGLNKDMLQEILALFKEIDEDSSGFISLEEFMRSLSKLGMTAGQVEAAEIFSKFDKSGDGKIDYDEFKEIMMEKMKKNMMQLDDLLADLREAFKVVDIENKRELSEAQLNQALLSLGIELSENEIRALFSCLDINSSRTIDIDEFIGFIMSPPDRDAVGDEADNAIYNIRKGKKISPSELLASFKDMPYNFVFSFTRELLKKLQCLPSAALKPKSVGGVLYADIVPNKVTVQDLTNTKKNQNINLRSLQPIPSAIAAEIRLHFASGVPIPDKSVDRNSLILGREVRACLFDRSGNKFFGNLAFIPVNWNQKKEDEWSFPQDNTIEDCSLLIRLSEWDSKTERDMQLSIVFEFVLYIKRNDQIVEMSSCWAALDLHNIRKSGAQDLQLQGGSPLRISTIDAQDVRTERKGWRNVVKKLSSPVRSRLKIEYKSIERLPVDVKTDLEFLPSTILLSKNALPIYTVYREYLGRLYLESVEKKVSIDLTSDLNAKAFRKIIDCPDTRNVLYEFWNTQILRRYSKDRDPSLSVVYLEKTMTYLGLLLNCTEFRFNHSDPTGVTLLNPNLQETRDRLAVVYMKKALDDLTNLTNTKKNTKPSQDPDLTKDLSFKPFSIEEFMDDDSEIYLVEQMKTLRGGARK